MQLFCLFPSRRRLYGLAFFSNFVFSSNGPLVDESLYLVHVFVVNWLRVWAAKNPRWLFYSCLWRSICKRHIRPRFLRTTILFFGLSDEPSKLSCTGNGDDPVIMVIICNDRAVNVMMNTLIALWDRAPHFAGTTRWPLDMWNSGPWERDPRAARESALLRRACSGLQITS